MAKDEKGSGWAIPDEEEQEIFKELIKEVTQRVRPDLLPKPEQPMPRVGRNDPCPCGSGRKYKRCHGAKEES